MPTLHPNALNPTSWRVQRKSLQVQKYFPFKKHGSPEAAEKAAREFESKLEIRLLAKRERQQLDINQLFDEQGFVRGIGISVGKRGVTMKAQLTLDGKQRANSRMLGKTPIEQAWGQLVDWLIEKKQLKRTRAIERDLIKAYALFQKKYESKLQQLES